MVAPARPPSTPALPMAWAYAAVVLYASLYPFTGWRWPPGHGAAELLALPWPPWRDPFDLWFNLLGYLPFGALVCAALHGRGERSTLALAATLSIAAVMSYATEVVQHFLPGRHPSLKDCAMNTLGAALGGLGTVLARLLAGPGRLAAGQRRWFVGGNKTLLLLVLWPCGLLFPAPVPLGLGQIDDRLRELLLAALADVPWAQALQSSLGQAAAPAKPLSVLAEGLVTAVGLFAPCMVAFAITPPGPRRVALAIGALMLALATMTLSTLLNFGPAHALAWIAPATLPALFAGTAAAVAAAGTPRRTAAGLGLVAIGALVALVAQAPQDPYFAQSLHSWEQGQFVRFHGLAQWIGWLWPYAAMAALLKHIGAREP